VNAENGSAVLGVVTENYIEHFSTQCHIVAFLGAL
jgi:hypothetical protein